MKRSFLILATLFILHCTNNPNPEFKLYKLHYENSSGEKGVSTFDYNVKGQIQVAVWELLNGNRFSVNFYTYDSKGNQIQKHREFSDSLTSTQHFYYNDQNQVIRETYERSDGRKGEVTYYFDQNNRKIKADCKGLNGWFHGILHYHYNQTDKPDSATIHQQNKRTGLIEYLFHANGQLIKEYWDFTGKWSQTFTYEYGDYSTPPSHYTSSNVFYTHAEAKLIHENYTFNNEAGGPSLFEYDNRGKLIKKQFIRSDSLTTTTYYLYSDKGILNRSIRLYSTGKMGLFRYKFNNLRKLTQRDMILSDKTKGFETYAYNDKGQLVSAQYNKMDTWLTGDIQFNYKGDCINNAIFTGKDGFNADITFEWDPNKNPIQIKWDFSFGKFQEYNFKYQ